jgi:hypothetical protein
MWNVIAWRTPDKAGTPCESLMRDPRLLPYELGPYRPRPGGAARGYPRSVAEDPSSFSGTTRWDPNRYCCVRYPRATLVTVRSYAGLDGRPHIRQGAATISSTPKPTRAGNTYGTSAWRVPLKGENALTGSSRRAR